MEVLKFKFITIAMVLAWSMGIAQEKENNLDDYLVIAAENNPGVKVAYNQYLAALEKVPQVGSLPDPQATFGFFVRPMELLGGDQVGNLEIMQMFPWFGTLGAAKNETTTMAKARFEEFNAVKSDLFFQVKSSWYTMIRIDNQIILMKQNIELLESLEKIALIKIQSAGVDNAPSSMSNSRGMQNRGDQQTMQSGNIGKMDMNGGLDSKQSTVKSSAPMGGGMTNSGGGLKDLLRVKMEILELKNKLALLEDQRETEQFRFNTLLNRNTSTELVITDTLVAQHLPAERSVMADSIIENNPMLKMLQHESSAYMHMEARAGKMGAPMLGAGINYMLIRKREGNEAMMNGKDMIMPMVSVTIPIYRKRYNSMQKEAQIMQEVTRQQTTDLENDLLFQYNRTIQDLDDAERRMNLYLEQESLARRTTDLLLAEFTSSSSDYEEVLRMQLKALEYGFMRIQAVTDYNTGVANLEKLINAIKF